MFAYCGNNPAMYSDPEGYAYNGIYRQINYNEYEHTYGGLRSVNPTGLSNPREIKGTLTFGLTGTASAGVGATGSGGVTMDLKGNVGVIGSPGVNASLPTVGSGFFISVTNADNIYLQRGLASQEGASINGFGVNIGLDHSFFENPATNDLYQGYTLILSLEASTPFEMHGGVTQSYVAGFNIIDALKHIFGV